MTVAALIEVSRRWARADPPPVELVAEVQEQMEQMPPLSRAMRHTLEAAQFIERAGEDPERSRVLLLVGGLPVDVSDLAASLGSRFKDQLKTEPQRQAAATYLQEALRARRRAQSRARNFALNW